MLDYLDHHTRGPIALLIVWLMVMVPLWVGLFQGRAAIKQWIASPIAAVVIAFGAGIVIAILQESLKGGRAVNAALTLICLPLAGYASGRYLTRFSRGGDTHKRGTQLDHGRRQRRDAKRLKARLAGVLTLAGIAVPPEDETKHFKMIGTTGTGKSTAIRELVGGALERGDRAIFARMVATWRGSISPTAATWSSIPSAEIP